MPWTGFDTSFDVPRRLGRLHDSMKRTSTRMAQQYEAALRNYLKRDGQPRLRLAQAVGKLAVALGLRALDLARLHDQALSKFGPAVTQNPIPGHRADAFFAEVFTELEQTTAPARKAAVRSEQLNKQQLERTIDPVSSSRIRKQGFAGRKALKDALKKKTGHCASLVAESRGLQRSLQSLTRRLLSAQENERSTMSKTLHDNVAQAMLGIQIRLAHLKKEAARNTTGLKKELTITQRLVRKSVQTLERVAGKLGKA